MSVLMKIWSVFAGVVAALIMMPALPGPLYARAQITSTTVTEVPIESITPTVVSLTTTAPTLSSSDSIGSMTVQCWRTTTIAGSTARLEVPTSLASFFSGVVCWEVYPLNGGVASVPITSGPNFLPTSADAAVGTTDSSTSSPSSSNNLAKILPAALIGSLAGVALLILTTIYLLRWRNRRKAPDSRARRWADRNSTVVRETWAMKETPAGFNGSKPEMA